MEERLSPAPSFSQQLPHHKNDETAKLQSSDTDPSTFVVRIPKDQVYRLPNPENAHLAELHKKSPPKKAKTSRCCLCCILFSIVFFFLIILLGGLLGGLFSMIFSPKDPKFSVERFNVAETKPKYDITLKVHNSNSDVGISYKSSSHVTLSQNGKEIANGDYPSLNQDPRDTTSFGITLKGSTTALPNKAEKSLKNTKTKLPLAYSLAINSRARMKMGLLRSRTITFHVSCNIKLDKLPKTTQIVSQQCQTKRH
ncbi:hypothetical protein VNO80_18525 [Phaseolus coccineus]|uniref:Late embryogenesis abundant protein LEA-2 subgroup domain-containing protein n=1 Tax=Phaseolus coccineus TaxID=3886 RepID=A0AAN9QZR6_PHACN